ncbi:MULTISPECIES: hypothetical protein [unclassified Paenibacillus]|nr:MULTISPECIES: hypothetical protein [unclassified Paenibacillus]
MASLFAWEGAKVVLTYSAQESVHQLGDEINRFGSEAIAMQLDVTSAAS